MLHGPPTLVDWRFESQLTSWQHPMFGLKPLGHLRSPSAPGGMVVIEPLQPEPADHAPAAAPRPAAAPEAVELPLQAPPPVVEEPVVRPPARPSDVDEWGFPVADSDPSFVQSVVEAPRELAYYPRFEPEPAAADETPAEGALRTLGAPEQAFFEGLRPRLEPISSGAPEEAPEVAAPQAALAAPELPLVAPPPPAPPAPEPSSAPGRVRVRFGEPPAQDAEPAPIADVVAPPPVTDDRSPAPPDLAAAEPLVREPGELAEPAPPAEHAEAVPGPETSATAEHLSVDSGLPLDLDRGEQDEPVAPVLAESEPLVAGVEGEGDEAWRAGGSLLGEVPLELALRPETPPEPEHQPVTAYFPPSPEQVAAAEAERDLQRPLTEAAAPVEPGAAAVPAPVELPRAVPEAGPPATAILPPPAPPEVLPLVAERDLSAPAGETVVPVPPPAPPAPAGGALPLAPPAAPAPVLPPPLAPPRSRGEVAPPPATEAPQAHALADLPVPPPAAEAPLPVPPQPAPPPASRPAPDLTFAQPSRRDGGPGRERAGETAPGAPAAPEPVLPPPAASAPPHAGAVPPPATGAAPEMPLAVARPAAGSPAAPPSGTAMAKPDSAPEPAGESPIVGDRPLTSSVPVTAPTPEDPAGGTAPDTPMPLAQSAPAAMARQGSPAPEPVSVAPLLGERGIPLQSQTTQAVAGPGAPLDGGAAPLPEPAISVRSGRSSDVAARQLQARAFTHEGEVHLSSTSLAQGPREVEALVAHEMTHVLQQRILGPGRLPVESTLDGAALEAEARTVEQTVRSTGQFRVPQTSPVAMELARYGTLAPFAQASPGPVGLTLPQVAAPGELTPPALALPQLTLPSLVPAAPAAPPAPPVAPPAPAAPPAVEVQDAPTYQWEAPWAQVQRAPEDDGGAGGATTATTAPTQTPKDRLDDMHPVDKAELADELYPFIETRLRNSLRRHRDRAGRVTDMDL